MKETVTETKTVEEERTIKICDYCRLVTSEYLDDDQEFGEVMLNPTVKSEVGHIKGKHYDSIVKALVETDDEQRASQLVHELISYRPEDTMDICPYCEDDLFGEGPVSMRRDADERLDEFGRR